jgi:hypothetical protein
MESVDELKQLQMLKSKLAYLVRKGRTLLDRTAVYRRERWSYLIFFTAYVLYRIFRY